ncbi:MAG: RHS repeat-associated core domain-containing protein, partial [Gammaproteobacteria bacterium]|nr:RHS repeat-associated core domain-containing protein [Gammaproteobacteria bacterium]
NYDANGNLTSWIHDNSKATRFMQWDDENRLQKVTEANSITRFKYDDQGQRKVKFHHKPNSGTGKETIYINQFYNVSNRAISTKHIFAGTSRMVSKLKGGSILLRESSDLTDDHYTGANDKPRNPGKGKALGKNNGKGKKLGHDKGKGQGKKQNGKAPSNGKGAKKFQDGGHPGQGLEHRSDRANEVAQNVYKNPNLQYLLDDPNSPYYQGGTPGQSDPDAPIQNEDGTIHDAQIIVIGPTDDQLYFFHPDHLGSTSYVTDEDGDIHEHVEYFPFGETWYQEGGNNKVTPYLFTSKELDSETGYYYFGARYYDPRVSTWISPDPILAKYLPTGNKDRDSNLSGMGGVFNSFNMNLYHYSGLNPARYVDPDGNAMFQPTSISALKKGNTMDAAMEEGARFRVVGGMAAAGTGAQAALPAVVLAPGTAATAVASTAIGEDASGALAVASTILSARASVAHFAKQAGADLLDDISTGLAVISASLDTTIENVGPAATNLLSGINKKADSLLKGVQSLTNSFFGAAMFGQNNPDSEQKPQQQPDQ